MFAINEKTLINTVEKMTGQNNVGLGTRMDFIHLGNFKLGKIFNLCKIFFIRQNRF